MVLEPGAIIAWMLVALPVSLCASLFVRGRGYGSVADVGVALLGAVVGIFIVVALGAEGQGGWLICLLATVVGAVALTRLVRAMPGRAPA